MGAGCADVVAACGFDQFGDPGLGVDEGLSPLFAVDTGRVGGLSAAEERGFDGRLHLGDEGFAFGLCVDDGGDEAYVFVDVREAVRGEGQNREARFEDRGEGVHTVGDAGDHQVGFGREDLVGVGGPAVVEDVRISLGQFGEGLEAIAGAGAEVVQTVQGGKSDGDRWLQGGYAHFILRKLFVFR